MCSPRDSLPGSSGMRLSHFSSDPSTCSRAERNPGFFFVMLFLGLAGFFYSLSGFLGFSIDRPLAPSWITVGLANVVAGLFMAGYLFRSHPGLWVVIRDSTDPETEHPFPAAGTGPRLR